MDKPLIQITDLQKSIAGRNIIDIDDISIYKNKIYAVVGPNGAGKTSLFRLILGLYMPDKGSIVLTEKCDISAVLENDYLYERKTGRENIECFLNYWGGSAAYWGSSTTATYWGNSTTYWGSSTAATADTTADSGLYAKYASLLKLEDALDCKVSTYSKGMKRKLSILMAVMRDASLIVLDEPTSGLDPESRFSIRNLIQELKSANKTILISSHDLSDVEKTCDVVLMLGDGKIKKRFDLERNAVDLEKEFFSILVQ